MFKNDKVFRILSSLPIDLEILEFDDAIKCDDYADYVDFLEMNLPNEIKL
jgi:hypothetical protein